MGTADRLIILPYDMDNELLSDLDMLPFNTWILRRRIIGTCIDGVRTSLSGGFCYGKHDSEYCRMYSQRLLWVEDKV